MTINKNYVYFEKIKNILIKLFPNEYVVVSDENVLFHSSNLKDVLKYARKLKVETYIIQKCVTNIERFNSRVVFE